MIRSHDLLRALGASLLLALAACSAPEARDEPSPDAAPAAGGADSEAACLADGGTWAQHGRLAVMSCARPTADAGRMCRDGSDCETACIAPEGVEDGTPTAGTCHASDKLFGCHTRVTDGVAGPSLCID
ncbi:hypothetical protein [Coralloluteibacterium stylophorae]|uniref:Secreted protein n=1 Tax=Coralloluteibacterium stylophorae TaxID=1776034 RepID=A0A8J7VRZ8_9GAMM|nr:hypothetical protein [Coralloluteibacterium stylophorae]MBS7458042.1 hypothetical protein [Coralloluteibacterium stylophorae]